MSAPLEPALRRRRWLSFAAIYLIWGSSYLAARIAVLHLPALLMAGARFCMAGLIMLGIARRLGLRVIPARSEWPDLAVLALLGFVLSNGSGVWGLQFVPSNVSALLNASVPFWLVLLGAFGRHAHRPAPRALLGLALGFAGTLLVLDPLAAHSPVPLWPQLVVLLGCVAWAASTIRVRNRRARLPVLTLIGLQMLLGGLGLGTLGLLHGDAAHWHWSLTGALALAYLTVFASCIAHTAYAWLAQQVSPARLATYGYVNPAIATVLGWLVLGETLSWVQGLGMAVILASVIALTWPVAPGAPLRH